MGNCSKQLFGIVNQVPTGLSMQVILPLFLLFSAVCGKRFLTKAGPVVTEDVPRYLRDTPYLNLRFGFENNKIGDHVVSVKGFKNPERTLAAMAPDLRQQFADFHHQPKASLSWDETAQATADTKLVLVIDRDGIIHQIKFPIEGRADEPDTQTDKYHLRAAVEKLVEYQVD
eukprot:Platyproteum_vivax@DN7293_c0_g3_i4.p1